MAREIHANKEKEKKGTFLKLELIKQYGTVGRCILIVLRLQKKTKDNKKGMSQQVYGVSRRKSLNKNNEDKVKLEIAYSLFDSGACRRKRCLPFAASSPARWSISKGSQSIGPGLSSSRAPVGTGASRRRRRIL